MGQPAQNVVPDYRFQQQSSFWIPRSNSPDSGRVILFPGVGGHIPVRGCPDKQAVDDMISKRSHTMGWDMHSWIFDLEKAQDREYYDKICTGVANNRRHRMMIKDKPCGDYGVKHWKILVRWGEQYVEPAKRFMAMDTCDPLGSAFRPAPAVQPMPMANDELLASFPDLRNRVVLFPGVAGVPMRHFMDLEGAVQMLKTRYTVLTYDLHSRLFDLEDPTDHMAFDLLHSVARGNTAHVWLAEMPSPGFAREHWKIMVRWGERYIEPTGPGMRRSTGNPLEKRS